MSVTGPPRPAAGLDGAVVLNLDLIEEERRLVREGMERVRRSLHEVPKTRRWRLRARVGERVRWLVLPDEVES